jgi:signal transduction histidine kinase
VDPILIEQVLVNLLKNAAESSRTPSAHGPTQRGTARGAPPLDGQPVVEFSVLDSGKGLAPEVMDRLYEAFFSTKTGRHGHRPESVPLHRRVAPGRMKAENIYNGAE